MKKRTLCLLAGCLLSLSLLAADWPQWRGPARDDVSKETHLLTTWPKEGPRLLWTFEDAGIGYSGPAIVGDRLYTMGGDGKKEFVFALDLTTRKKAWSTEVGPFYPHGNGDGPRGTPTVDGDLLFCLTGHGELLAVETKGGKVRWRINLKKDLGGEMASGWGYSESVLVDGDRVVCTPGGRKGALAALERGTGKVLWRSTGWTARATYSSIIVAEIAGVKQYVQVTGEGVAGVAAEDGKLLWQSNQSAHGISVSTPVHKDDLVYVSTGYGVGGGAVKVVKDGDTFSAEKVYDRDDQKLMMNHHGGFVLVGEHVYGYSDSRGWICQELRTGKLVWRGKARDLGKGSLTCADGHLYCYSESGGKVALVEASPAGYREKGHFTIPKRSKANRHQMAWTHPVVANGRLYLRDQEYLFCYDVKAAPAAAQ
jgi:outer membrane protein assembly factor BamB